MSHLSQPTPTCSVCRVSLVSKCAALQAAGQRDSRAAGKMDWGRGEWELVLASPASASLSSVLVSSAASFLWPAALSQGCRSCWWTHLGEHSLFFLTVNFVMFIAYHWILDNLLSTHLLHEVHVMVILFLLVLTTVTKLKHRDNLFREFKEKTNNCPDLRNFGLSYVRRTDRAD